MSMSKEQHDELCVSYASLVLFDGEAEITSDAISAVIAASGNEVAPYWPTLFASLLAKSDKVLELISSGGPAAAGAAAVGGAAAAGGEEAAAEEEKEEEEEAGRSMDIGGGMDMFGGGADY
ncbi:60s acidic ribosomal protein p1, partial [Globisporangium splendens]